MLGNNTSFFFSCLGGFLYVSCFPFPVIANVFLLSWGSSQLTLWQSLMSYLVKRDELITFFLSSTTDHLNLGWCPCDSPHSFPPPKSHWETATIEVRRMINMLLVNTSEILVFLCLHPHVLAFVSYTILQTRSSQIPLCTTILAGELAS